MEDDILDPKTGKPRRHDGKDPWSFMDREEVGRRDDLGAFVPTSVSETIAPITIGGYVEVVIVRERADLQGRYEAIWLEVTGLDGDTYDAVFDNQPTWVRGVASGDAVRFEARHVLRAR